MSIWNKPLKGMTQKKLSRIQSVISIMITVFILFILTHTFFIAVVPTLSMYPTLSENEFVLGVKTEDIDYGDVVTFYASDDHSQMWIKRLIGKPGDIITVYNGTVLRNGAVLDEPYIYEAPDYDMEQFLVPDGTYFVMGDNRNNSADSHVIGPIDADTMVGKMIFHFNLFDRNEGDIV